MAEPSGSTSSTTRTSTSNTTPTPTRPTPHQPGAAEVLLLAAAVVAVVIAAAVVTGFLPTEIQRAIFHGPVLIGVLIVGTGWLLWRISRGRPLDDDR